MKIKNQMLCKLMLMSMYGLVIVALASHAERSGAQTAETLLEPETVVTAEPEETYTNTWNYQRVRDPLDRLIYRWLHKREKREWTAQEKECLARNIYHEAANEPVEGQVAVAVVTLNRANDPFYPSNICDVVYQRGKIVRRDTVRVKIKKHYEQREVVKNIVVCQFSWTCEKVKVPGHTDAKYQNIKELVEHFADGGFQEWREKYSKSLHYHAYYVNPRWKLNRLHRVGAHIFYD